MQDAGVSEQDAEEAGASWYLSRDGQQHGPLSYRELSLFAEGGNFKPGDLLWTAGLDAWKPADAIFGLASSKAPGAEDTDDALTDEVSFDTPAEEVTESEEVDFLADVPNDTDFADAATEDDEAAAYDHPDTADEHDDFGADPVHADHFDTDHFDPIDGDHVGALAKAIRGETEPRKLTFQERMVAELRTFGGLCGYLWVVFVLLTLHALVGGAENGAGLSFFLLTTVNAFVLTQLMPRLEEQRFFAGLKQKPLIYSILYKTVGFVTLLFVAYAIEMGVLGLLGIGGGPMSLADGLSGTLVMWIIFCCALLPYFAFKELQRTIGTDVMAKLLFGRI